MPAVLYLFFSGYQFAQNSRAIGEPSDIFSLFSHDATLRAWDKIRRFVSADEFGDASSSNGTAGLIFTRAGFDAFIVTAILCYRDDGTETISGHR